MNNTFFTKAKQVQKNQPFHLADEESLRQINFDQIPLLPNQVGYVMDCSKADIVDVRGDTSAVFGIKEINSIDQIYDRVKDSNVERFVDDVEDIFSFSLAEPERSKPYRNVFSAAYELHNGKKHVPYLRQSFTLRGSDNGIITHTVGVYTLQPSNAYEKKMSVLGQDAIYFHSPFAKFFEEIFSIRELQILKLISQGYSARQIAEKLFISKLTVDTHRKNMINKLEVNNTPHLVGLAKDMRLI